MAAVKRRSRLGCALWGIFIAIVGGAFGLFVFLSAQAMRGIFVDEVTEIPDNQSQSFDLLVPDRKIPKSSTKITVHVAHFQDATNYTVKFDAPLADAKAFMVDTVGPDGRDCRQWLTTKRLNKWPKDQPAGALCREDLDRKTDNDRPITIAVIPHGTTATVLVYTSL